MSLDSGVVIVPGVGHFYTRAVSGAYPTDPADPTASGWVEVGHTSRENPMQVSRDGGDQTILGSWQNPTLRTSTDTVTTSLAFTLLQYDNENMALYYGSNSEVDGGTGRLKVAKSPSPTEAALFVRIIDGTKEQYRYYEKVSIIAADAEEFDVESLAGMPVAATILGADESDFNAELTEVVDTAGS
jgi:hypothetical protein